MMYYYAASVYIPTNYVILQNLCLRVDKHVLCRVLSPYAWPAV